MQWPIEKWNHPSMPYVPADGYTVGYGGLQERYWVNSAGLGLYVDWDVPLWLSVNAGQDGLICFKARFKVSEITSTVIQGRYHVSRVMNSGNYHRGQFGRKLHNEIKYQCHYIVQSHPHLCIPASCYVASRCLCIPSPVIQSSPHLTLTILLTTSVHRHR